MANTASGSLTTCPNCRQPMQSQAFERHDSGVVQIDLCFECAGIWFDHLESIQLSPRAVIDLFREIQTHADGPRHPVAARLDCPRCAEALTMSFDLAKSGRFSYFRCCAGDGRFTPFFQFLREKQFVRTLTPAELQQVRSQVRQIRCSECGAPIDLEHDSQCKYCHAPVSFLDPDAVRKAVAMWSDADDRRHLAPTPEAVGNALLGLPLRPVGQPSPPWSNSSGLGSLPDLGPAAISTGIDLVSMGIHALGKLFVSGD